MTEASPQILIEVYQIWASAWETTPKYACSGSCDAF